jgi:hypothetical protein
MMKREIKYEAVGSMHRRTLAFNEKVLGKEYLLTLTSMYNLAPVLDRQGKYEAAEAINRETLAYTRRCWGRSIPLG